VTSISGTAALAAATVHAMAVFSVIMPLLMA
jgi:hypothetical protein